LTPLPAPSEASAWGAEPICWQPLNERWIWPGGIEPVPLAPHLIPRIVGVRYLSKEAEDAELAESSREIEAERRFAQGRKDEPAPVDTSLPWWRDITVIRHARSGEITERDAEGRVMRALAHSGELRPTLRSRTTAALLAALSDAAEQADAAYAAEIGLTKFTPLPKDHEDFLTAMAWFAALNPPEHRPANAKPWGLSREQRVLYWRSRNRRLTWNEIGFELNPSRPLSVARARQLYESGIHSCWRVANGRGRPTVDHMAVLRERNRQHRNRETSHG
jgi:alkylated DNA nucleotide flippase Atl1